jgi:hypothetical protein
MRKTPTTPTTPPLVIVTAVLFAVGSLVAAPPARAASAAETTAPAAETASGGFAPTAEAGGGFGAEGQLALSMGATAGEHFFFHKSGGAWQLHVAPAADYFVIPHLSVGGVVAYDHASGGGGPGTSGVGSDAFMLEPRAGYSFGINDKFSVWPLGGFALRYLSANHAHQTDTWFTIYLPVLFHPAQHFFVGLGPSVRIHLTGQDNTEWGLDSVLGGWF